MMQHQEQAVAVVWPPEPLFGVDLLAWLRAIEPKEAAIECGSLVVIVREAIEAILLTREHIRRGDARRAAEAAAVVGALTQDFRLRARWEEAVERAYTRREREQAAAHATAERKQQLHASWRQRAEAMRIAHPDWSASRIARAIDPKRWQTVRKKIGQ